MEEDARKGQLGVRLFEEIRKLFRIKMQRAAI